jgi:predicted DNA-binding protein with PD1-like motif
MKYQTGRVGRTFVVRFEDKDKFLESVVELARKEKIRSAVFFAVGGITEAKIVVGPEKEELPPNPVWRELTESHEAVGVGTIFWQGDEPKIHFHGAYGKKDSVKVGCLREAADTFIVLEAVILEIEGIDAVRALDPLSNMVLLKL